jgi:hypothetical protein
MVAKIYIVVLWVMVLCISLVGSYWCFRGTYCFIFREAIYSSRTLRATYNTKQGKDETGSSSKTLILSYQTITWCHNPEDNNTCMSIILMPVLNRYLEWSWSRSADLNSKKMLKCFGVTEIFVTMIIKESRRYM